METIKSYLDNMFRNLPKTREILKLHNDLLSNMEDKYNELKNEGKSENEAIGIVISEFGNIDELINELGINVKEEASALPIVTEEEAYSYMAAKKAEGLHVSIGVSLCILGAAMLIFINKLIENNVIGTGLSEKAKDMPGLITLIIMVVPAVALFIYSGMKLEKYNYLKSPFNLPISVKGIVEQKLKDFQSTYTLSVIIGVSLCILSPIALFITDALDNDISDYGVVILLLIVTAAVFIFIYYGNIKESYSTLLKIDNFSEEKQKNNKVIGAVAAAVWPLAVCIYIISGFVFHQWHINWIIFPVTGILFGMFCAVYSSVKGDNI